MDKDTLNKLKAKKRKHYKNAKENGEFLYGIGKGYRVTNREDIRGKRRYGHRRYSVKQAHRIGKKIVDFKRKKLSPYKCYYRMSYLNTLQINDCMRQDDTSKLMKLIYDGYRNIYLLLDDYLWGYRDILFSKIVYLSGIFHDEKKMAILLKNYPEILVDSILDVVSKRHEYIAKSGFSFFTFVVNITAFTFVSNLNRYIKLDKYFIDSEALEGCLDVENYSPLSAYIYSRLNYISVRDANREH